MAPCPSASDGALQVRALAGTRSVLLVFSAESADTLRGALGFAVSRRCGEEEEEVWLGKPAGGSAETPAHLTRSAARKARGTPHTICSFLWGDYATSPDTAYAYTVFCVRAASAEGSGGLRARELVEMATVRVQTEGEDTGEDVHFNRGVAGSQGYAERFGASRPREVSADETGAAWEWLSRGLEEALLRFLARAEGAGWAIRAACYEFTYEPVLRALARARDRGVEVCVVYDSKPSKWNAARREWEERGPSVHNDAAVRAVGIEDIVVRREKALSDISHNKFFLLSREGRAVAVWTGSTNITASGLFGHLNVGHVCSDPHVLDGFSKYWEVLAEDLSVNELKHRVEQLSPLPSIDDHSSTVIFSPRANDGALCFYADLIRNAQQAVFMTAAFGISARIAEGLLHLPNGTLDDKSSKGLSKAQDHAVPTYLLLEKPGEGRSRQFEAAVRKLRHGHVACGCHLPLEGMHPGHKAEQLTGLNKHVNYVHTKLLLVDPFSEWPTVVSGSANFSVASTTRNDENMLVLRGEQARRVARLCVVEFMRVFRHFAWRRRLLDRIAKARAVEVAEKLSEEKLNEEKLSEENLSEEKLSEEKLNEEKLSEEKLNEEKLSEEKLSEEKLSEEKLSEETLSEETLSEETLSEEKLFEQKLSEERFEASEASDDKWLRPHFYPGSRCEVERLLFMGKYQVDRIDESNGKPAKAGENECDGTTHLRHDGSEAELEDLNSSFNALGVAEHTDLQKTGDDAVEENDIARAEEGSGEDQPGASSDSLSEGTRESIASEPVGMVASPSAKTPEKKARAIIKCSKCGQVKKGHTCSAAKAKEGRGEECQPGTSSDSLCEGTRESIASEPEGKAASPSAKTPEKKVRAIIKCSKCGQVKKGHTCSAKKSLSMSP
ncbi:hypothetical protein AB1Y20_012078 [Prymnesium parvum]|uniref:Mitochondrial cardiolipin hydrolase n=1 Tax=Prymnesium parvum TaxID=97485 RepID=A0AB34IMG3_PRYPA